MLSAADSDEQGVLAEQLRRLYNIEDPAKSIFRGCTTKPPLSLKAVQSDPQYWDQWVDDLIQSKPDLTQHELYWLTYKEVLHRGAEMYMPIFEASNYRFCWISGQLDPCEAGETEAMIRGAEELSSLSPNVMI